MVITASVTSEAVGIYSLIPAQEMLNFTVLTSSPWRPFHAQDPSAVHRTCPAAGRSGAGTSGSCLPESAQAHWRHSERAAHHARAAQSQVRLPAGRRPG